MNLLLTGGTGFFGRALLKELASHPPVGTVTVLTRNPKAFLRQHPQFASLSWLECYQGDVTQSESLRGLEGHQRFSHILHAATDSSLAPGATPPTGQQQLDQIVLGTRNLLNLAVRNGLPRFLLTSSGGVYGPQPPDMAEIPETYRGIPDPLLPGSTYGLGKRLAEHLCTLAYHEAGLPTVVARCFAFVGEDLPRDAHFAIGNFIRDALERDAIVVGGDGSPLRSYLCQTDLAHWLLTLLKRGASGEAYNVGSDVAVSVGDLAHLVRDILAPSKAVKMLGHAGSDNRLRNRYIPSIAKARDALGLTVRVPLDQAIRRAARDGQICC